MRSERLSRLSVEGRAAERRAIRERRKQPKAISSMTAEERYAIREERSLPTANWPGKHWAYGSLEELRHALTQEAIILSLDTEFIWRNGRFLVTEIGITELKAREVAHIHPGYVNNPLMRSTKMTDPLL